MNAGPLPRPWTASWRQAAGRSGVVHAYAEIVQNPQYRDNKERTMLSMLPDLLSDQSGGHLQVRVGTATVPDVQAVLVSNNPYGDAGRLLEIGDDSASTRVSSVSWPTGWTMPGGLRPTRTVHRPVNVRTRLTAALPGGRSPAGKFTRETSGSR